MSSILIRNARLIDQLSEIDKVGVYMFVTVY
jgi:hypothetical protein